MKAYYFASFTFFATYERQPFGVKFFQVRWFGDVFDESQQFRTNVFFFEVNLANGNVVVKVVVDCQVGVAVAVAVCVGGVASLKCLIVLVGVVSVSVRILRTIEYDYDSLQDMVRLHH